MPLKGNNAQASSSLLCLGSYARKSGMDGSFDVYTNDHIIDFHPGKWPRSQNNAFNKTIAALPNTTN
jgi:hypothetical protein